jgi:hypothetical protein
MGSIPKNDQWVWVLVQNPDREAQIVGQQDNENGISFIPTFLDKEQAQRSYHLLVLEKGIKDEFQAMIFEDLAQHAADNGFSIFILDASGKILEKIKP